jgi:hypothetical protein
MQRGTCYDYLIRKLFNERERVTCCLTQIKWWTAICDYVRIVKRKAVMGTSKN